MLELDGFFFWVEDEVCGCWHKWRGATRGPRDRGRALQGGALLSRGLVLAPPAVFSVPKILKYSIKNHTKFAGHLEHFYFRDIFYCTDNSENSRIILFLLYLFQITESKRRVQKVVPSSFIHLVIIKINPLTRLIKSC